MTRSAQQELDHKHDEDLLHLVTLTSQIIDLTADGGIAVLLRGTTDFSAIDVLIEARVHGFESQQRLSWDYARVCRQRRDGDEGVRCG